MAAPRILIVSDSLGTPTHGRGILNYTAGLLGAIRLNALSATLLVERPKSYRLQTGLPEFKGVSETTARATRLAAIHGYLSGAPVHNALRGKNKLRRLGFKIRRTLRKIAIRARLQGLPRSAAKPEIVRNSGPARSFRSAYLDMVESFAVVNRVYTGSLLRSSYDLSPPLIDATDFDLVLVDTPHFIQVKRHEKARVALVIHDLIPVFEWDTPEWRNLFLKKLFVSLEQATHLIFVSETTRSEFNEIFPDYSGLPSTIISPTIRLDLLAASGADRRQPSGEKPTFLSIVSDEPRKNIGFLIEAFTLLKDAANLVIIGRVDPSPYVGLTGSLLANIRFAGYVSDREKVALLRAADGMIFASTTEGFGIPIVEGTLFGLPVFCSDLPVFRECTNNLAKYFDPFVPEELVALIRDFLAHSEQRQSNVAALREYCVSAYGVDTAAAKLKALLPTV